ncbi:family 4 glycosyl hydrolase [Beduini massiliensis]|uniref:family 4 glycosyl hydrolase n=1 Tax=Beduini massiliensis TaxID=1585974 RepID=UPI0018CE18E8|nr:hypothetical protein [Beduini massiliensis]
MYGNKLSHIVVTTKNNGTVPDLPANCAVEISSYIGSSGAKTIAFGKLQPAEKGWLQCMKIWSSVLKKLLLQVTMVCYVGFYFKPSNHIR